MHPTTTPEEISSNLSMKLNQPSRLKFSDNWGATKVVWSFLFF